ncbi:cytoplasmic dynein 2 heavy chain 1-like [Tachysurus fulvidraco]|uniref:cytoplasmic dynein 2 heavy chain 1-like n=1 Tax=Tachysurus fulvidraco TaxID=1234273 RepID=UPI001FEFD199|nr:cytoplasmic dynein 2 heavy chain 1-like [Tachysurus fulvidraco]
MTVMLQKEVDKYKAHLPVVKYVRGDHLSQDHWLDLFRFLNLSKGTTLERLLFKDLLTVSHTIIDRALDLKDLNSRAHAEFSIREVELWAAGACFSLTEYTNSTGTHISLIGEWRDVMNQVGDNRCLLQSLKDSPYYQCFHDKVSLWETRLTDLHDFLQSLNSIQRKWLYLEPIYGRGALRREQARFHRVDQDFRAIMSDVQRDTRVTSLTTRAGMRNALNTLQDQLQNCQ